MTACRLSAVVCQRFNQGPFFVRAHRELTLAPFAPSSTRPFDVRAARTFSVRRMNIKLDLDFFHLLNFEQKTTEADLTSNTFAKRVPWRSGARGQSALVWSGTFS